MLAVVVVVGVVVMRCLATRYHAPVDIVATVVVVGGAMPDRS